MTTLEALVSVSHTLLKAHGRWCVLGTDEILRRDIEATVHDVSRLLRTECGDIEYLASMAIRELERQAARLSLNDEPPHTDDDDGCDPLYGLRMDSADMGEC